MNLKYYLRGLGIGLIVTTIMLTISHNINDKTVEYSGGEQTTSGSPLAFERDNTTKPAESVTERTTEAATESVTERTTEAVTEPVTERTTEPVTEAVTEASTEAPTSVKQTTASVQNGEEVTVIIKDVYYGTQAADILYEAGLITDKNDFVQYLISTGYGTKIQEGTYKISKGAGYEEICKTISRK